MELDSLALERLQERLGFRFGDRRFLIQAMTHTSFGHEFLQDLPASQRDNERLEFLGDAVLDLVISDLLLERFPEANEGHLTRMRAAVVNEKTLAQIARELEIASCLRLGKGELSTGGNQKPSILSSALEALVASIYLDGGYHAIYPVLRHVFAPFFSGEGNAIRSFQDYKTQLQEMVQAKWKITPTYHLLETEGPDHAKVFRVEVRMQGKALAVALGSSKKEAEQNAAWAAIQTVG